MRYILFIYSVYYVSFIKGGSSSRACEFLKDRDFCLLCSFLYPQHLSPVCPQLIFVKWMNEWVWSPTSAQPTALYFIPLQIVPIPLSSFIKFSLSSSHPTLPHLSGERFVSSKNQSTHSAFLLILIAAHSSASMPSSISFPPREKEWLFRTQLTLPSKSKANVTTTTTSLCHELLKMS